MRILFVEDEPDLGDAVKRALLREKHVVDWVMDGREALSCLESDWMHYNLAIFDWLLPGMSGLELCQWVRQNNNPMPILMLTAKDTMRDKVAGLDAGADDYLVKPFGMDELLARLRALQRRSPALQPSKLQIGGLSLDYGTCTIRLIHPAESPPIPLTTKEFQLLEYFMQHPNQILTRDQLMNQIWAIQDDPLSNVVAAQIRLLRRKLAGHGCEGLIETIYGMGYRFNA